VDHIAPYGVADSLKLATLNALVATAIRVLGARGGDQSGLLTVGVALAIAPTLAVLAVAFSMRDLKTSKAGGVVVASILTVMALGIAWWPLLEAD